MVLRSSPSSPLIVRHPPPKPAVPKPRPRKRILCPLTGHHWKRVILETHRGTSGVHALCRRCGWKHVISDLMTFETFVQIFPQAQYPSCNAVLVEKVHES